ncbi:hypothetical protein KY285_005230 [Solanum tuberosum]|nr:hypothetical protein KY284_005458 [Solanum tuberosum]KAH0752082.1 hypothetical protein KY285_005230 [Solanum tuberosum]
MITTAVGQPQMEAGQQTFGSLFRSTTGEVRPLPLKPILYLHGEPRILWEQAESWESSLTDGRTYKKYAK